MIGGTSSPVFAKQCNWAPCFFQVCEAFESDVESITYDDLTQVKLSIVACWIYDQLMKFIFELVSGQSMLYQYVCVNRYCGEKVMFERVDSIKNFPNYE